MASTLSAAASGITVWLLRLLPKEHRHDLAGLCNGMLGGLVAVCAGADVMTCNQAIVCGAVAGVVQELASMLMEKAGIDDPVGAFAVHGSCGMVGVMARSVLCTDASRPSVLEQFVGLLSITAWSAGISTLFFIALKAAGLLVCSHPEQVLGGDKLLLASSAYVLTEPPAKGERTAADEETEAPSDSPRPAAPDGDEGGNQREIINVDHPLEGTSV
jgi:Amt family ammonium transporter